MEEHRLRGGLLQYQHGFPQAGGAQLFLQAVPRHLFQGGRSGPGEVQCGSQREEQPDFQRLHRERCRGGLRGLQEELYRQ